MNAALAYGLVALCFCFFLGGLGKRGRIYEFPFLASAMFVVFILPQLPGLAGDSFLPDGAYAKTIVFTTLCLAMCGLGWAKSDKPVAPARWTLDESPLLATAAILSLIGAVFYFQLSRLPGEITVTGGISGFQVVQLFFAKLLTFGLGIALLCFAKRPSLPALFIIAVDTVFYLDRVYVTGKRGEAFEFIIMAALAVWFRRGKALPRMLVVFGILAGTILMGSTHSYREMSRAGERPDLSQLDVVENFKDYLEKGGAEMRNALLRIHAADTSKAFDYGLFHWNVLVYNFVPAQLFGAGFKASLVINVPGLNDRYYDPPYGTTETGMADAFQSFWYLGAVKFFVLAFLMGRIYRAAMAGDVTQQLIYLFSAVPAMHIISHHTQWLVSNWVQMAIFLGPVLLLIRRPRHPAAAGASSHPHTIRAGA